jgi:Fanconi anemia group M protein
MNFKIEPLLCGDYYIPQKDGGIVYERKTVEDLLSSVKDRLFVDQLPKLVNIEGITPAIILEGWIGKIRKFRWHEKSVYGLLKAIAIDWSMPIIPTPDKEGTIIFLMQQSEEAEKEPIKEIRPLNIKPKLLSLDKQARFVIESLPNIGPNLADRLLKHFGTVRNVITSIESLKDGEVEGIGKKTKEDILKVLDHRYCGSESHVNHAT